MDDTYEDDDDETLIQLGEGGPAAPESAGRGGGGSSGRSGQEGRGQRAGGGWRRAETRGAGGDDEALLDLAAEEFSDDGESNATPHRSSIGPVRRNSSMSSMIAREANMVHVRVERVLQREFHKLGLAVARDPYMYFFACFAACAIITAGISGLTTDDDPMVWYPHRTQAYNDAQWREAAFGVENNTATAIGYLKPLANASLLSGSIAGGGALGSAPGAGGPGIVGVGPLTEMFGVYSKLMFSGVGERAYDPDLCSRSCANTEYCGCNVVSVFPVFAGLNGATSPDDVRLPATDADTVAAIRGRSVNQGVPVLDAVLGKMRYDASGAFAGASAMLMSFEISNRVSREDQAAWQGRFRSLCDSLNSGLNYTRLVCTTSDELGLETDDAVADDEVYVAVAVVSMLCYVSIVLARCDLVDSRYLLSLAIVLIIGLSLGVAFGIAGYTGLVATQVSFLAVFILFGLGVDDMFLLVDAFDRVPPHVRDPAERCGEALGEVGSSILFTSLTTFLALLVGSTIDLPAVSSFCVTTAVAVAFVFMICLFMFLPLLVLNERRIAANRYDLAPCFVAAARPAPDPSERAKSVEMRVQRSRLRRFMKQWYVPFLTHRRTPPLVVVGFCVAAAALGTYGVTNVGTKFSAIDYLPDTSELRDFINIEQDYFGSIFLLDFLFEAPDLNDPQAVTSLCTLEGRIDSLSFVLQSELLPFWGAMYADWYGRMCTPGTIGVGTGWNCTNATAAPAPKDPDYDCFRDWIGVISLADSGRITENFVFGPPGAGDRLVVTAAKYSTVANATNAFGYNADLMAEARNATQGLSFHARAFAVDFLASERTAATTQLSFQAVTSTIVAVFVVSVLALSPIEAVAITISVVFVVVDLIGMMALWSVDLNVTSIVFLCLAVGFSVDYAAHVTKSISDQDHKLPVVDRVRVALSSQGVAVLHAALSTFVATVPLSVASSLGFRILFRLLLGTVGFGVLHGLVFMPCFLLVLPAWCMIKHHDSNDDNRAVVNVVIDDFDEGNGSSRA